MFDLVLRGGTVVDGTGAAGVRADVGVRDGRIVEVGELGDAARVIDVDGLLVVPGFVDPHTHYDAQLFWDPTASPSNVHGVTTVIGGNCGFTLAPLDPEDADYLRRMMAKVEGMPLEALENGVEWTWRDFGEYLERVEGTGLGVNAGFLVGHCALRRKVMGKDAVGQVATAEQVDAMRSMLGASLEAGGLGFSTSRAFTHSDGDGEPVPSRHAAPEEVLALCEEVAHHPGTTLEAITDGCLNGFSDEEVELFARMSSTAQRPLNWNVLTVDSTNPAGVERQLAAADRAAEIGGRIVALTMPILVGMNMNFASHCALFLIPGWGDVLRLPRAQAIAKLRDPEVRRLLDERAHSDEAGVLRRLTGWGSYRIGDTFSAENAPLSGRTVAEIATERTTTPFDTLLDIVIADDLRTVLWPSPTDDDPASWELRAKVWTDERVLIGGSDAGAHLDRMCGAPYPTAFLGDCLRGRRLLPVEEAVRLMTSVPADLFGLRHRGRIVAGSVADLVVLDPATVDAGPIKLVDDLPGGTSRLVADSLGVRHVFLGGVETVHDGVATGALPGRVLRSGRDTDTVTVG